MSIGQIQRPGVGSGNGGERYEFRQCVLAQIGRLTPRMTAEIWGRVNDDWGPVGRWRIDRALRWLRINGQIRRTEDGYLLTREARHGR